MSAKEVVAEEEKAASMEMVDFAARMKLLDAKASLFRMAWILLGCGAAAIIKVTFF